MNFFQLFAIVAVFLLRLCSSAPMPQTSLGVIHGSPVIAIIHGDSDILKDEVQAKDSEDDPLSKFGKIVD